MSYEQYRPSGFNYLPPVVKNLLILNGLFFLATMVLENRFDIDLLDRLALYHYSSEHFKFYQYVTYMFLHGGFTHILFNMLALWMFGNVLENTWGSKRFLVYYMVTGIGAAAVHTLYFTYKITSLENAIAVYAGNPGIDEFALFVRQNIPDDFRGSFQDLIDRWIATPDSRMFLDASIRLANQYVDVIQDVPTVGASGAVYGLLLAFGILFPNTMIYMYMAIPIKAKYFVILYGAIELYLGVSSSSDNVAHFAHLGGMLFGLIFIRYWGKY